ncbi:MAG: glucosaminidase domain-containing protein, partial [Bacteroidales bacterium]|nr:glucosaminidase domain-containing protein [Bacteroidales bacterium]
MLLVGIIAGAVTYMAASPKEDYIRKYAAVAVSEMYRSGVPASITLAQGLLESNAGQSTLATKGNNHFGIKCHDWKGKSMRQDDDAKNECFRVYDDPFASFRDHSDFLRYWDRYKFLFENRTTDYKAWANGLKKAGYATDPAYPSKL